MNTQSRYLLLALCTAGLVAACATGVTADPGDDDSAGSSGTGGAASSGAGPTSGSGGSGDPSSSSGGNGSGGNGSSSGTGGAMVPGDLVITEIMNNPALVNDNQGEWFEVYNDSFSSVDLQGLVIRHQAGDPNAVHTIDQSVVVAAGGYAVLGINANTSSNGNVPVDYQYATTVSLNNTTDYLALEDTNQMVIDEVTYDESSGLDPSGKSRNLDPLYQSAFNNDTDLYFCEASSTISGSSDMGSPGSSNDTCP